MKRALVPALLAAALAACVSLEEAPLTKSSIAPGQRTVVAVYVAPGPYIAQDDSKGETAAKIIPGLGLLVQDAQDSRDLSASKELQRYLTPWDAALSISTQALAELGKTPHPGKWLLAQDAGLTPSTLGRLNESKDVLDWRKRYYLLEPDQTPARDYSKMLELDDAMVFEINLAYGLNDDGEGGGTPAAWAVGKLYRANTMKQLWRHEESVVDAAGKKLLYDYKVKPDELVARWKALMPQLAQKLAQSYSRSLMGIRTSALDVASGGAPSSFGLGTSTAAPFGQPFPPGQPQPAGQPFPQGQPGQPFPQGQPGQPFPPAQPPSSGPQPFTPLPPQGSPPQQPVFTH
jgi:hypothetical protein